MFHICKAVLIWLFVLVTAATHFEVKLYLHSLIVDLNVLNFTQCYVGLLFTRETTQL